MRPDKRALADRARADRSNGLAAVAAGGKGIWHPVPVGSYEQLSISLSRDEGRHGARQSPRASVSAVCCTSRQSAYMGQVNQSRRAVSWRSGVIDQQTSLSAILTARAIADDDFRLGACRKELPRRP